MENKKKSKFNWIGILMGSIGGATLIAGGVILALRLTAKNQQFTIDFDINSTEAKFEGSTHVNFDKQITFGEINKPNITQTPAGKVFAYWSWDKEGTKAINDSDKIESKCNVFAQWKDEIATYKLTFEKGDATTLVGPAEVGITAEQKFGNINKPVASKNATTQYTYTFDYWSTDGTETGKVDDNSVFTANTSLKPVFKSEEIVQYYNLKFQPCIADTGVSGTTVTFNGESSLSIKAASNQTFKSINKPTLSKTVKVGSSELHYSFSYWVKNVDGVETKIENEEVKLTGDTIVSPVFEDEPQKFETNYFIKDSSKGIGAIIDSSETEGDKIKIQWQDDTTTEIQKSEFNEKVYIGSQVTSIAPNFLAHCPIFNQEIEIPNTVTYIGAGFLSYSDAFNNGGKTLTIPGTVTNIGSYFLNGCAAFNQPVVMNSGTKSIGDFFLANTKAFNSAITFPNTLTNIGNSFLSYADAYNQDLTFPASLTWVGDYFLYYSDGITTANVDLSKTTITTTNSGFMYKAHNFAGQLTLPTTVKTLGYNFMAWITNGQFKPIDFTKLTNLSQITGELFNNTVINWDIDLSKCTSVKSIGTDFLRTNPNFNSKITLPNSITTINNDFMRGCSAFNQTITLPSSLTKIGSGFMAGCTVFNQSLSLPETLTSIGDNFLAWNTAFNQPLSFSDALTSIGDYFLLLDTSFNQNINLPDTVKKIPNYFMYGCEAFAGELTYSDTITEIGDCFLQYCSAFNYAITVPATVTSVGYDFLGRCNSLNKTVTILININKFALQDGTSEHEGSYYSETFYRDSEYGKFKVKYSVTDFDDIAGTNGRFKTWAKVEQVTEI